MTVAGGCTYFTADTSTEFSLAASAKNRGQTTVSLTGFRNAGANYGLLRLPADYKPGWQPGHQKVER